MAENARQAEDPFTEAYRAVLRSLTDNVALVGGDTPLVAVRNRLAVVTNPESAVEVPETEHDPLVDVPELLVTQGGFEWPVANNSKETRARQAYTLQVLDSKTTVDRLNRIKWQCMRSFARAARQQPCFGLSFCDGLQVTDTREGRPVAGEGEARPAGEWVAVATLWLDLYWDWKTITF